MRNGELGVLVVGHGTRDPNGQAQMRNLACQIAGCLLPLTTELGFLELAEPTIADGISRLAQAGVRRVVIVPVLLFRAGHADRDIPEAVQAAAILHNMDVLAYTPPLEEQASVLALSAERFHEAIQTGLSARAAGDATQRLTTGKVNLAMIARGSSSQSAADKMEQFAASRCQLTEVAAHRVGYVAVRQPNVAQTLDWLAGSDADLLVVQPHLLFEGEVLHGLIKAVDERRAADGRQWIVARPLGAPADNFEDHRLAQVFADLAKEALPQA